MPYEVKGKCIFKKDGGAKVGCTKGSVDKYLAALHANADESVELTEENKLFDISMPDADWAIYRISNGEKCYITRLSHNAGIEVCDYRAKYSDEAVLKFTLAKAKELIKKNIYVGDKLGVVNSKGNQQLFDWKIKYENKDVTENTKSLIKRLIRENLTK